MKLKTFIILQSTFLSLISFSSCSNTAIKKDGLLYGEVVGELYHTQYWNSNDHWDLKNMYLILHYDDESIERVYADDPNAHYTFSPESPTGLPIGETSFSITSGYYVDYKGEPHEILPREFNGVYIIKNPNPIVTDDKVLFAFRIIVEVLVLVLIPLAIIIAIIKTYKKKKKE